ncbi:inhibitor of the pro-sigma K processing machinery [Alkalithermobacter thermoalcaliphilus JW-YL-7 = DSM 7308]|uniref:Inhibitor of the pro-sigma K processing machinery n=1 Tax=Alkalithermobacter thermoalcaliphilus JW-YL-7 = DSM 7308 TaxID=1121328 RepID=A0A150FMR5_CLOPD|nr:sigmaK-factor processing regulatory BofA [[Clostridium] paradoxum JW-YL-7 = DSM 7308]SHL36799.1 inhibitor of the pro-sigma K processing machinery [[Clostridium] paradoxum JW-YL-7 = DSM 7308]
MDATMQIRMILIYGVALLSVYTIFLLLVGPLKALGKMIFKVCVGGLGLFTLNQILVLTGINLTFGINIITSVIAGYLGIVGILSMVVIKLLIV